MKASRAVLWAGQFCVAALVTRPVLAAGAPSVWSDLWRTPDQQGQALLDAGQPAQAAERFHDPRRRGYADLEAGRYDTAAKQLAPLNDAQSEYNRGNALARSGNLQAALTAYDTALKQAPADGDIRHNRDLVARALQQQRQSPQSSSPKGGQGQPQQQPKGQQHGKSGSRQSGSGSQSGGGGQTASNGSQSGANRPDNGAQQHAVANGANTSAEAPGQAQRDAAQAAALARAQRERGAAGNKAQSQGQDAQRNGLLAGGTRTPKQQPETERQLALDQWLRQIPDSAAGLLQR
ncbi:MAG TPA: tetratricopeptide repeat protein, partial [Steroidobacteraceae bacterium]